MRAFLLLALVGLGIAALLWSDGPGEQRHRTPTNRELPTRTTRTESETPPATKRADVDSLFANFRSEDREQRKAAATAIQALGADAVPGLRAILRKGSPVELQRALKLAKSIGKNAIPLIPDILRILDADTAKYRPAEPAATALDVLKKLGPDASSALPTLIEWLGGDRESHSFHASHTLRTLGRAAKPALPAMLAILDDETLRWDRGTSLIRVVEGLGPDAKDAAPAMLAFIHDMAKAKAETRDGIMVSWAPTDFRAASALAAMGPSVVPAIIESLGSDLWDGIYCYQLALKEMGDPALPALIAAMDHENATVRKNVADLLGEMKKQSDEIREALERATRDPNEEVRAEALESLASQGKAAVPALVAALKVKETQARAARALASHGAHAEAAIPDLIELTRSQHTQLVELAAIALGAMGARAADAAPALVKALARVRGYDREKVAVALGRLGSAAVPAILEAVGSPDPGIRAAAARALRGIRTFDAATLRVLSDSLNTDDKAVQLQIALALAPRPIALPALIRGLKRPDLGDRRSAAGGIIRYESAAKQALPALFDAVRVMHTEFQANDKRFPRFMNWTLRDVGKAIRAVGPHDVPLLVSMLRDDSAWVREEAERALQRAGPNAIPALANAWPSAHERLRLAILDSTSSKHGAELHTKALQDSSIAVRIRGARGLWERTKNAQLTVPVLIAALDADGDWPSTAAHTLKQIGRHAAFAKDALRRHLNHRHHMVPYYLKHVLAAIESE